MLESIEHPRQTNIFLHGDNLAALAYAFENAVTGVRIYVLPRPPHAISAEHYVALLRPYGSIRRLFDIDRAGHE